MEKKKCKIWILNQNSYMPEDGPHIRHYTIGKYLARKDYEPYVFAANELHHVGRRIDTGKNEYIEKDSNGVKFLYIKTFHYTKNDIKRIINIASYYFMLFRVCKRVEKKYGKPDIIYASQMYPTALVAGIKLAKKYKVKCICESRDLIPEGFVTNGTFKANGIIAKVLRNWIRKIYYKSDALIFTMSGGEQYIIDNKWDISSGGKIDLSKVHYINNGVDLEVAKENEEKWIYQDKDIEDKDSFKVVYFGAIRFLNKMSLFIETASALKELGYNDVKILMWGNGTKLDEMRDELKKLNLDNIKLKGYVDKKYIPSIAKRADVFIGTGNSCIVGKYGMSFNKLFDYLAGEKPIILPFKVNNSIVEANNAGIEMDNPTGMEIAKQIIRFKNMPRDEYNKYCENSRLLANKFDYRVLTKKVDIIIKSLIKN